MIQLKKHKAPNHQHCHFANNRIRIYIAPDSMPKEIVHSSPRSLRNQQIQHHPPDRLGDNLDRSGDDSGRSSAAVLKPSIILPSTKTQCEAKIRLIGRLTVFKIIQHLAIAIQKNQVPIYGKLVDVPYLVGVNPPVVSSGACPIRLYAS
jgi:hypothetical protein